MIQVEAKPSFSLFSITVICIQNVSDFDLAEPLYILLPLSDMAFLRPIVEQYIAPQGRQILITE